MNKLNVCMGAAIAICLVIAVFAVVSVQEATDKLDNLTKEVDNLCVFRNGQLVINQNNLDLWENQLEINELNLEKWNFQIEFNEAQIEVNRAQQSLNELFSSWLWR